MGFIFIANGSIQFTANCVDFQSILHVVKLNESKQFKHNHIYHPSLFFVHHEILSEDSIISKNYLEIVEF